MADVRKRAVEAMFATLGVGSYLRPHKFPTNLGAISKKLGDRTRNRITHVRNKRNSCETSTYK
jgi:hypothetical protein